MQISFRSTVRSMIGNIQKLFLPKTGMRKKQVLQDPGYVEGVKSACIILHAILQGCTKYPMSKEVKEIKNSHDTVDLKHLSLMSKESKVHSIDIVFTVIFLMSKESKVHSIYNTDSNTKSSNYIKI